MKKLMLGVFVVLSGVVLMSACSKNSLENMSPDSLAKAVNSYEESHGEQSGKAANCGQLYLHKLSLPIPVEKQLQGECAEYAVHLADYLKAQSTFSSISVVDVKSEAFWSLYFKSNLANGNGFNEM